MQQEKHQLKKVIFMTLARRIHERTAERSQHNIYSAFSKGYKKNPRNSMHLALFCEEKPKGKVIRRELTRVYLEPRDFNLVTQKESISR